MKKANSINQFATTISDFILGAKGVMNIETSTSSGEFFTNRINKKTSIRERERIGDLIFSHIQNSNFTIKLEFSVGEDVVSVVLRGFRGVIKSEDPQRLEDGITK